MFCFFYFADYIDKEKSWLEIISCMGSQRQHGWYFDLLLMYLNEEYTLFNKKKVEAHEEGMENAGFTRNFVISV